MINYKKSHKVDSFIGFPSYEGVKRSLSRDLSCLESAKTRGNPGEKTLTPIQTTGQNGCQMVDGWRMGVGGDHEVLEIR